MVAVFTFKFNKCICIWNGFACIIIFFILKTPDQLQSVTFTYMHNAHRNRGIQDMKCRSSISNQSLLRLAMCGSRKDEWKKKWNEKRIVERREWTCLTNTIQIIWNYHTQQAGGRKKKKKKTTAISLEDTEREREYCTHTGQRIIFKRSKKKLQQM